MLRSALYLLVLAVLVACADRKESAPTGQVAIRSLSPVGEQWQEVAQGEMPEELTLLVEVENRGARLKILSGEVGVRYNGRKVAILSLLEEVSIAGRRSSEVELRLKLHMTHNSHSRALVESLRRRSVENVALEWKLKVRRGLFSGRVEQEAVALTELVGEQELERLWQMAGSVE